jgi:hypothetical protein
MATQPNNISYLSPKQANVPLPRKEGVVLQFPRSEAHTASLSQEMLLLLLTIQALDGETQMAIKTKLASVAVMSLPEAIAILSTFGNQIARPGRI